MKKIIVIILVLTLVIPISILSISEDEFHSQGNVYVDDDAAAGWYDATHVKTTFHLVNDDTTNVFNLSLI